MGKNAIQLMAYYHSEINSGITRKTLKEEPFKNIFKIKPEVYHEV